MLYKIVSLQDHNQTKLLYGEVEGLTCNAFDTHGEGKSDRSTSPQNSSFHVG